MYVDPEDPAPAQVGSDCPADSLQGTGGNQGAGTWRHRGHEATDNNHCQRSGQYRQCQPLVFALSRHIPSATENTDQENPSNGR